MFFWFLFLSRADFVQNHGLKIDITRDACKAPLLEQIYLFALDYSTVSAKNFLVSTLNSFTSIDDEEFIMAAAKKSLGDSAFNLLHSNLQLNSLIPKVDFVRSLSNFNGSRTFATDLIIGTSNSKNLLLADLHNKEDAEKVLSAINNNKDVIIRLKIDGSKCEEEKMNGYGIRFIPQSFIGGNIEEEAQESVIPEDETVKNVKDPTNVEFNLDTSDLHTRFFQYLSNNKDKDMLTLLRDITNNWPLYMQDVFGNRADQETANFYEELREYVSEWEEVSSINGRNVYSSLDAFSVLQVMKEEERFIDMLKNEFNLTKDKQEKISFNEVKPINYIFDYRDKNVDFLNDIEKDKQFEQLSPEFDDLYEDNIIPLCRKNLIDIISYVDPSTIEGYTYLKSAVGMLNNGIPVRVGIMPIFNLNRKLSRKVAFAYHHIALRDQEMAVKFILRVANYAHVNPATNSPNELNEMAFQKAYSSFAQDISIVSWNDIHTLYSPNTPEYKRLTEVQNFYKEKGIKINTICMNGRIEQAQETPHAYFHYAKEEFNKIKNLYKLLGFETWPEEHPIELYKETEYVVSSLKLPTTNENFFIGLGVYSLPVDKQKQFIHEMENLKWNHEPQQTAKNFYMLFTNSESDANTFMNFAEEEHRLPTKFAVNPEGINLPCIEKKKLPVIVCGGRVFEDVKITEENLQTIDNWFSFTIFPHISKVITEEENKYEQLVFFMETMICDWFEKEITRGGLDKRVFDIEGGLVYDSPNKCDIKWQIALNPFASDFQEMIDVIKFIEDAGAAAVQLVPNPQHDLSTYKNSFSSYYRAAIDKTSVYLTHTNESNSYSTSPNLPSSWVIQPGDSNIDINNINFNELQPGVYNSSFKLSSLVARGVVLRTTSEPAYGAEIELNGKSTIVMRDSGYWQFPINASYNTLHLADGTSTEKYHQFSKDIIIDSYAFTQDETQVKVIPGMEGFRCQCEIGKQTKDIKPINIFTIPSDKTEEKFAKSMMISIMKNTKHPIKFWIYNEFITRTFKDDVKRMSEKYNFEFEFIGYTRPLWLRPQMFLSRVVKAKKLLYYDVAFPLDIDRVIYVDPFAIIKSDISELAYTQLNKSAIAMPSFCENNIKNETMKDRYWSDGYWKNYLKEKPYLSADLFIVDLQKLRNLGYADKIRFYYQRLSGSLRFLAILDQDLLNYLQPIVPIKQLDEEWYWSNEMCKEEAKNNAKVINLRMTVLSQKEDKQSIEEIVPEWNQIIKEVEEF